MTLPSICLQHAASQGLPAPNPYLSAPIYGITHFNPAQTDTIPYSVRRGEFRIDLTKQPRIPGGPINIMNLAAAKPGFMWLISTDRVAYVDARDGAWTKLAEIGLPGVPRFTEDKLHTLLGKPFSSVKQIEQLAKSLIGPAPQSVTANGLYTVADRDNVVYVNAGTTIFAIGLKNPDNPADGLEVKRSIDAKTFMPAFELSGQGSAVRLIGMNMTYDGHLVVGAINGIAVIDRTFEKKASIYVIEPGQMISNSITIDEGNGIYVASGSLQPRGDGILRKLIWTGDRISDSETDGAWRSGYDGGDWPPAIKAGTGTGSTPTLMGFGKNDDRLVVLADGVNRMKIVAFWRDEIPADFKQKPGTKSRRIADQMQLTGGLPPSAKWMQSEQSVVVNGWGAFVVNNIIPDGHPDKLVDVLAIGPVTNPPRGMERVRWDYGAKEWVKVWTRGDVSSTSMVPVASSSAGIVFVSGYSKNDGWQVTGLDWDTGQTVHRTIMGHTNLGNGAYAILQFTEDGDLLFNSIGGPFRIKLK